MRARMRHRFTLAAITAALALAMSAALAHEGHHHNAMGTVRSIQATQLDLETKDGKVESFTLTNTTAYKRGDTVARHEDVKVGERAVVMYETKAGQNIALEIRLGAAAPASHVGHAGHAEHAGHGGLDHGATTSGATTSTANPSVLREVEPRFVCMINNALFDKPQIPVEVAGKTYFGCCEMCKERLAASPAAREAVDPVSGRTVDKATSVIGVLPSGAVVYFENAENLATHRTRLNAKQVR